MSAHSPGPWQIHPLFQTDVMDAAGASVGQTATSNPCRFQDARLIAAAPELLEALEGVLVEEDPRARTIARALIRRIEEG